MELVRPVPYRLLRFVNSWTVQPLVYKSIKDEFLIPTAALEMLWELMRLYDWRIITYISSFPVPQRVGMNRKEKRFPKGSVFLTSRRFLTNPSKDSP